MAPPLHRTVISLEGSDTSATVPIVDDRRPHFRLGVALSLLAVSGTIVSCDGPTRAPAFPELTIVTDSLPPGIVGETYSEAVHAEGGDGAYDWEVSSGELPPGLGLTVDDLGEGAHAIISGVPDAAGEFGFALTVISGDGQSAAHAFDLTILPSDVAVSIETPAVPPALEGAGYEISLEATGGEGEGLQWTLVAGSLPAGLDLSADGRIVGTPADPDTTEFTVRASSAIHSDERSYELAVVPHRQEEFNITIFPVTEIPEGVRPHLEDAVRDWEIAITDDLPPIEIPTTFFPDPDQCGGFGDLTNGTAVDDILIIVSIEPIDGPGGVLGRAGPCGIRSASRLPFVGVLILDSDDLEPLIGNETLTFIISHEIAHVLGFGTLWGTLGLIEGAGGPDPRFVGDLAVQEYQALGGDGTVPVENDGGEGTRDGHWRQSVFGNERMTGFSAAPGIFQPLSRVSVASFADKGYVVDLAAADDFSLSAALRWTHDRRSGHDEILGEPVTVLYPDGRTRIVDPH